MSTQHVSDPANSVRKVAGEAAVAVRERAREVQKGLSGLDKEETNVAIGTRLAMQAITDERVDLSEEGQQLMSILGAPAAPTTTDPQPPAAPTGTDDGNPPTEPTPVVEVREVRSFRFADWSIMQWILAIIGLIIGLLVGVSTYDFGPAEGLARAVIAVVWVIALSGLGFFLGGLIGSFIPPFRRAEEQAG